MQDEDVPAKATVAGAKFVEQLQALPAVTQVRGLGLLLAVELDSSLLGDAAATQAAARLLDSGVVVNAVTPTALRLAPSLLISDSEIDEAVTALSAVFTELMAEQAGQTGMATS
jgi:acetylornithine/succinyldiaminopimelate/putrescine aminotransferase